MNFDCSHCHTRYHIADDKVRGKILQVRCRSCQNLVEVKDPALDSASHPASAGSMTLLGIAALPRDGSIPMPKSSTASLPPPPKATVPKPAPPMPSYGSKPLNGAAKPSAPLAAKPAYPAARPAASASNPPAVQPPKPPPQKPTGGPSGPTFIPNASVALQGALPPARPLPQSAQSGNGIAPAIIGSAAPTPAPTIEPKQWYYNHKGQRQGPFRFSEITALVADGTVRPEDYSWAPEVGSWKQVKDIAQFSAYLPKEPPPFEDPTSVGISVPPELIEPPKAAAPVPPPTPKASVPPPPVIPMPASPEIPKPPVVVKSPIAPQSNGVVPSPSAVHMQASVASQAAGPSSMNKDIFAAVAASNADPLASIPNAADFKAPHSRDMSALIPISATKPPIQNRLLVPALIAVSFVAVAALAFTFGQGTKPQALGAKIENKTDESAEDSATKPVISDKDIQKLGGLGGNNEPATTPTEPKTKSYPKPKPENTTATSEPQTPVVVKDPAAEAKAAALAAKTAADNEKGKDLFLGTKKSAVTPTPVETKVATPTPAETPASAGDEKVAMKIIGEAGGRVQRCTDRSLTNGEFKKETRLNVSIKIDKDGKVSSVSVGNAPANSTIETCLKGAYSSLPFAKAGGALTLNFPVIVTPSF